MEEEIPVLKGLIGPLFGATLLLYQNQIRSPKPVEFEASAPITRHATIIVASGMLGCLQSALQSRAQEKNCGDQTLLQKTSDGRWTWRILRKNHRMDILKRLCKSPSCESLSSNGCFLDSRGQSTPCCWEHSVELFGGGWSRVGQVDSKLVGHVQTGFSMV